MARIIVFLVVGFISIAGNAKQFHDESAEEIYQYGIELRNCSIFYFNLSSKEKKKGNTKNSENFRKIGLTGYSIIDELDHIDFNKIIENLDVVIKNQVSIYNSYDKPQNIKTNKECMTMILDNAKGDLFNERMWDKNLFYYIGMFDVVQVIIKDLSMLISSHNKRIAGKKGR